MDKKLRVAVVRLFGVLAVLIIIGINVLGFNLLKNRWHKLNFNISDVQIHQFYNDQNELRYKVEIKGNAKTWFYDFNEYQFMLVSENDDNVYRNFINSDVVYVNHKGSNDFYVSFDTDNPEHIKNFTLTGKYIFINGRQKEGTDIRVYMGEHIENLVDY